MESHLPCYISSGLLALLLVIQQLQHNRIIQALHDRILESKGMESVPKVSAINEMIDKLIPKETPYNQPKKEQPRVRFNIPGIQSMRPKESTK